LYIVGIVSDPTFGATLCIKKATKLIKKNKCVNTVRSLQNLIFQNQIGIQAFCLFGRHIKYANIPQYDFEKSFSKK